MKKKETHINTENLNFFGKMARYFSDQFQLTILVMILIVSLGVTGLLSLPRESLPEIVFPSVIVSTVYPGASPEDVEYLVTDKIENKLKELDDVEEIESETGFGVSVVTVSFREDADIVQKKNEVDNALKEVTLPENTLDPSSNIFKTSSIPLMNISIAGDYSQVALTQYAKAIKDKIDKIVGVEESTLSGQVEREIVVYPNELKMMQYGLDYQSLSNAISTSNYSVPVGEVNLNGLRYNLRINESFKEVQDIENTLITGRNGQRVYIKDAAHVEDTIAPISKISRTYIEGINDRALPSVSLTVSRKVGSDVIGTSQAIKDVLDEAKGNLVPEDLTLSISNDLAETVKRDISNIEVSALSGLMVVIVVLFIFIGFREALTVSITIPLSLLGTLGILSLFDITFNTFAILGLIVALGLLVDNSIIVMENIDRLRKEGYPSQEAAIVGTNQVGFPISSSTFTTIAAFFPLAILPGILGAFVSTIPTTIIIVILMSLIVSLIVTPSIAGKILQIKEGNVPSILKIVMSYLFVGVLSFYAFYSSGKSLLLPFIMTLVFVLMMTYKLFLSNKGKIIDIYGRFLNQLIKTTGRRVAVIVIGILVLVGSTSVFALGWLKVSFFPQGEPTGLNITVDTIGGSSLDKTSQVTRQVESKLIEMKGIKQFTSTIEDDLATINVELKTKEINGFDAINQIDNMLNQLTGATYNVAGIVSGPPVGKPIEVRLVSDDLEALKEYNREVNKQLRDTAGIYNIESSSTTGVPELKIDINENKSLIYGTSGRQIGTQLRGEISGQTVTTLRDGNDEIDVVLKKDTQLINSKNDIENLFIGTSVGSMIPLSTFADLKESGGISNITHLDGNRVIIITADLREGYNASEVTEQLREKIKKTDKIDVLFSGDVAGIEQNFGNLFQSMILAVFLVFVILTLQFKSISQPFIIILTIPMALIGVIWGLTLTGNDFGFYAFMGLVALVGIAVNDAIVLIDYMNGLRLEGYQVKAAVVESGKTRFVPVFATTLTTISGLLPLAFKEVYYAEFSFALIFGLMVTTLLTLIFIPTLYTSFESLKGGK